MPKVYNFFSFPCLLSYLLALVETLTKCLYLIAIARQSDNDCLNLCEDFVK